MNNKYDLIVIGGGPAGLSAAIYGSRSRLKTLLLETKRKTGGQPSTYHDMENYPGVPETTATELMENFRKHAEKFGTDIKRGEVVDIKVDGLDKRVKCKKGDTYIGKSIIIATGAEPRTLGVKGEKRFKGKGVSYCATCDADFFVDLDVVVVGNGNSAIEESIYLSKFVNKATIIVIHDEGIMDAEKILQEKAYKNEKIKFVWNSVLEEVKGDGLVEKVVIKNIKTGQLSEINCAGIFFFVGQVPRTDFLKEIIELDSNGYIVTNEQMETIIPGVYAVGDVRAKSVRQVITAAGDGATAAVNSQRYIEEEEYWQHNVLESEKTVLAAFWSPTDEKSIDSIGMLENISLNDENTKLVKIDTYRNKLITNKYQIETIPSVLIIKDGRVIEKVFSPDQESIKEILLDLS